MPLAQSAIAQPAYTFTVAPATYAPLGGSGTALNFANPDDGAETVHIGFPFRFFGATYTDVDVGANGLLTFDYPCGPNGSCDADPIDAPDCNMGVQRCEHTNLRYDPTSLPESSPPFRIIAPFWDDLQIRAPGQIVTAVLGSAPHRQFVVEWTGIERHAPAVSFSQANFQVRLEEGTNVIHLSYGSFVQAADASTWSGVLGVENADGSQAVTPLACAADRTCGSNDLVNLAGHDVSIQPLAAPELVGSISCPASSAPRQLIDVFVQVQNVGVRPTGVGFTVPVYLSPRAAPALLGATPIGTLTFGPMAAGAVAGSTLAATIPSTLPLGYYHALAVIDPNHAVMQPAGTSSVVVRASPLVLGPDLVADRLSGVPSTIQAGQILPLSFRVRNLGAPLVRTSWAVYAGTTGTWPDATAVRVATGTVTLGPAAAPGESQEAIVSTNAVIPQLAFGAYAFLAVVNPALDIAEADSTNNASNASTSVLGQPDVAAVSVSGPTLAFHNAPYRVTAGIGNVGQGLASHFHYALYLTHDILIGPDAVQLAELGPIDLDAGAQLTATTTVTIPPTVANGTYFLGLKVDSRSELSESNTTNNVVTGTTIIVRDPGPDFTVTDVATLPAGAAGEVIPVSRIFRNLGNAIGNVPYQVALSASPTGMPADRTIGSGMIMLDPGGAQGGSDEVRIPDDVAAGDYYVAFLVDPSNMANELGLAPKIGVSSQPITVGMPQLSIVNGVLPEASVGGRYDAILIATGGLAPYTWSLVQGALPSGLMLDANSGHITGAPTQLGLVTFEVQVMSGGLSASRQLAILVSPFFSPLQIISRGLPAAYTGRPYAYNLVASGGDPPYAWSESGVLPAGFTLDPNGKLSGTATQSFSGAITFAVSDLKGGTDHRAIAVHVIDLDSSLRFDADLLPDGVVGEPYDASFHVVNGGAPFVFSVVEGTLPAGLSISGSKLTGTPTSIGTSVFTVRVVDALMDSAMNVFVVSIDSSQGPRIVTKDLPPAEVGKPYLDPSGGPVTIRAVSASSTIALSFAIVAGAAPDGISLDDHAGTLRGTPSKAGVFSFTIAVGDPFGDTDQRAFGIAVAAPAKTSTGTLTKSARGCSCTTEASRSHAPWSTVGLMLALLVMIVASRIRSPRGALSLLGVVVVFGLGSARAEAQTHYFVSQRMEPYVDRPGGTPLMFTSGGNANDDDGEATVSLPFAFRFFGSSFTSVNVGTNGYVSFDQDARSLANLPIPSGSMPGDIIALYWNDLVTPDAETFVEGAAPARRFIIQYRVTHHFPATGTDRFSMQLWLFEGPAGKFEIHYGPTSNVSSAQENASVGFQNADGSSGQALLPCTPACDGAELISLTDTVLTALQDAGPDLEAASISAPSLIHPGVPFAAAAQIASLHDAPLGPFVYSVYLSSAASMPLTNPIFTSTAVVLAPAASQLSAPRLRLPLETPPGDYKLALVVDPGRQVADIDRSNNTVYELQASTVDATRLPDLAINQVSISTSTIPAGGTASAIVVIQNVGNADVQGASYAVVVTRGQALSFSDPSIGSGTIDLAMQATATVTVPLQLPASIAPGNYTVGAVADPQNAIRELDKLNNLKAATSQLHVPDSAVSIVTSALLTGFVGFNYSDYVRAQGGDGTYQWTVEGGALPMGLVLTSTTGEIHGVPTVTSHAMVTLGVTSGGAHASAALQIDVEQTASGLTIVTTELLPGIVGDTYPPVEDGSDPRQAQKIVAAGGAGTATKTFTLTSTAGVAAGVTLDADGFLHGRTLELGVFVLGVKVSDGVTTATRSIPLNVVQPGKLTLISLALPDAIIGQTYQASLQVTGNSKPVIFALQSGTLPIGLSIDSSGCILGTPTQAGQSSFFVIASEMGTNETSIASFSLTVKAQGALTISPASLPVATVGEDYKVELTAQGGIAPLKWSLIFPGAPLPAGLMLEVVLDGNFAKARISGRPQAVPAGSEASDTGGIVSFLAQVKDGGGKTASEPLSLRILPARSAPPLVTTKKSGCGCRDERSSSMPPLGLLLLLVLPLARAALRTRG
jgi:subtilase family serine protease